MDGSATRQTGSKNSPQVKYIILPILYSYSILLIVGLCSFYLSEGFLHLQNAVGLAIIEETIGRSVNINISVEVYYIYCM